MIPWNLRPVEEANLLNPAFCSVNIASAVAGYNTQMNQTIPYALTFLVLPIILHKKTRVALPRKINTYLAPWIQNNYDLRLNFGERVISLKPYTKEALIFAFNKTMIHFEKDGSISPIFDPKENKKELIKLGRESMEYVDKAYFVGRWFAASGSPETIMTLLGVKP